MVNNLLENKLFSQRARSISNGYGKLNIRKELISFSLGMPDQGSLPAEEIAEAAIRTMREYGQWPLQYGSASGFEKLLDFLAEKLYTEQKICCKRNNLLLTSGASQALGLLCELLLDPGDVVLSEIPTYSWALHMFKYFGAHVEGLPLDEGGLRIDVLEQKLVELKSRNITPKFLYVIPNFQNPTGFTTTFQRRRDLVELAAQYQIIIVEDDAYFDLCFSGEKLPTLYELANGQHIFYVRTFSKILAAGIRLGWIVGDSNSISRLISLKTDGCTNPFAAHIAYEYCSHNDLHERIRLLADLYHSRCKLMLSQLETWMPGEVSWTIPAGGFYIWLTLPDVNDSVRMLPYAHAAGIDYMPGVACFYEGNGRNNIRLSYSCVTEDMVIDGIQILASVIKQDALKFSMHEAHQREAKER